ncbi:MAG: hypothetical protein RIM80_18455, partial [Alphaproteobacteria bacterium]
APPCDRRYPRKISSNKEYPMIDTESGGLPADEELRPDRAAGGSETAGTAPDDWRAVLADDERAFAAQFASPADAVRTALDFRRKLSTAVQIPDPGGDPAARLSLFNRLGRPESVDGYQVSPPDNLPAWVAYEDPSIQESQRSFLDAMHAAGATQDMVDAALGWYWNNLSETETARDRQIEGDYAASEAGLRREWGRDFDRNLEHAGRAVAAFGGRDLGEILENYGLSSHPAVVRAFARVGRTMGEHDMISGSTGDTTQDQLRKRAEDLVAEDDYWTNETLQREMREIMVRLYGGQEIGPGAA